VENLPFTEFSYNNSYQASRDVILTKVYNPTRIVRNQRKIVLGPVEIKEAKEQVTKIREKPMMAQTC
jgi:hypothetical protein